MPDEKFTIIVQQGTDEELVARGLADMATVWRWKCSCGATGRWSGQSPGVAEVGAERHFTKRHMT